MRTLLAIFLAISMSPASGAGKPFPQLEVGTPFPMLQLPLAGQDGKSSSIMDYRGRKLMLHLFASW